VARGDDPLGAQKAGHKDREPPHLPVANHRDRLARPRSARAVARAAGGAPLIAGRMATKAKRSAVAAERFSLLRGRWG